MERKRRERLAAEARARAGNPDPPKPTLLTRTVAAYGYQGSEAALAQLLDAKCEHCGHKWFLHFDLASRVDKPCSFSKDGKPACDCQEHTPVTLKDVAARSMIPPHQDA